MLGHRRCVDAHREAAVDWKPEAHGLLERETHLGAHHGTSDVAGGMNGVAAMHMAPSDYFPHERRMVRMTAGLVKPTGVASKTGPMR